MVRFCGLDEHVVMVPEIIRIKSRLGEETYKREWMKLTKWLLRREILAVSVQVKPWLEVGQV